MHPLEIPLPDKFYKWQEFDCFTLAQNMRNILNLKPLPNFDFVYRQYSESDCPGNLIKNYLDFFAVPVMSDEANLVCLNWNGTTALGTFYKDYVIYIINKPVCRHVERLNKFIDSFWFY